MERLELFLLWKADGHDGDYIPIGRLHYDGQHFRFSYVKGVFRALKSGYAAIPEFPDIYSTYEDRTLFPIFANRLMNRSRKYFDRYLEALAISPDMDELQELARSSGKKATDRYRIVAKPERREGKLNLVFFAEGLTLSPFGNELSHFLSDVKPGDVLHLVIRTQNSLAQPVVELHTQTDRLIGGVPKYLTKALIPLLQNSAEDILCRVLRINYPPSMYAPDILLVEVASNWPAGWEPFSDEEFQNVPLKERVPSAT